MNEIKVEGLNSDAIAKDVDRPFKVFIVPKQNQMNHFILEPEHNSIKTSNCDKTIPDNNYMTVDCNQQNTQIEGTTEENEELILPNDLQDLDINCDTISDVRTKETQTIANTNQNNTSSQIVFPGIKIVVVNWSPISKYQLRNNERTRYRRQHMTEEQKQIEREKARIRSAAKRKLISEEKRQEINRTNLERIRYRRQHMTEQEKQIQREKARIRSAAKREQMKELTSEEKRQERNKINLERIRFRRQHMTEQQKRIEREKSRIRSAAKREQMRQQREQREEPTEEKVERNMKKKLTQTSKKNGKRISTWSRMTPEMREVVRQKQSEKRRQFWSNMSSQQKQKLIERRNELRKLRELCENKTTGEKIAESRRRRESLMTPEEIQLKRQEHSRIIRERLRFKFSQMTDEERFNYRHWWSTKSDEEKRKIGRKISEAKRLKRSQMSAEEKELRRQTIGHKIREMRTKKKNQNIKEDNRIENEPKNDKQNNCPKVRVYETRYRTKSKDNCV